MQMDRPAILQTRSAWAALRPEIEAAFERMWQTPELPGMEFKSAEFLAGWLGRHGFAVQRGAGGIPTAFTARKRQGEGPRIAILAEYDALPGLGNAAASRRSPLAGGAGHGCGHNHIGPANTAAAIAAASGFRGEIAVIGCPAEELLWGKIALLQRGVFDGFDAILTSHGDYQNGAISRPCQAMSHGEFVFLGEAGHGGKAGPRNALAAAERAVRLSESINSELSVKHVIRLGGIMPSITPDEARVWFTLRHVSIAKVRAAYAEIIRNCAQAAAEFNVSQREQFISQTRGYLANDVLAELLQECLVAIGPPQWSPADMDFMRQLSESASPGEPFELDRELRLHREGEDYYGQDDGELSWRVPLGRVNWAYPVQIPIHHWAWTALSGHSASAPGALMASQALAMAAAALLHEPQLAERAKSELNQRRQGIDVDMPRLGAWRTMTEEPQSFWNATWAEIG